MAYLSGTNITATGTTTALTGANSALAGSFQLVGGTAKTTALAIGGIVIAVGAAVTALLYMIDQTNKALDEIERAEGVRAAIDARTMGTMARLQRQGGASTSKEATDAATEARNRINRVNDEKAKIDSTIAQQQAYLEQQKKNGNAFVETVSVDKGNKPGWAYSSMADYIMYYLPNDLLVYVFTLKKLRAKLEKWKAAYPTGRAKNEGYVSEGVLVPLHEFERHANQVLTM